MQETWKRFVYPLIEDKKQDVEEDTYHRHKKRKTIQNPIHLLHLSQSLGFLGNV